MKKLEGKVAYITGSAMGNGEGIARVLARHGAHVLLADVSDQVLKTVESIKEAGYQATAYQVDVTDYKQVKESVDDALAKFKKIDILVNNAGVSKMARFLEVSDELRDWTFNINVNGVWNCTKAVLPNMIKQKYGKIINMSSVTGPIVVDEGQVAYATTKAALLGFTKALAREVVKDNINVNAICPGIILTPHVKDITAVRVNPDNPQKVLDDLALSIPMGRLGTIEEIGDLAAFLASDESRYITGTQVVIDGGETLPETVAFQI